MPPEWTVTVANEEGYGDRKCSGVNTYVELNAGRKHSCERCTSACDFTPTYGIGYNARNNNCVTYAHDVWEELTGEDLWTGFLWDDPETMCNSIKKANGGAASNVGSGGGGGTGGGSSGSSGSCYK